MLLGVKGFECVRDFCSEKILVRCKICKFKLSVDNFAFIEDNSTSGKLISYLLAHKKVCPLECHEWEPAMIEEQKKLDNGTELLLDN